MNIDRYIDELFASNGAILAKSLQLWSAGVNEEIDFWSRWFETRGLAWKDDYAARTTPQPLAPWLVSLLPPAQNAPAYILDVGAGPITRNGYYIVGREIIFTACDPLACHYNQLIDRFGANAPVRTQFAFAEDLSARFNTAHFDLVTCTNALDHAIEPVWGIIEMLQVAKVGGAVFLAHRRNEAEVQSYSGLHQWNFDVKGSHFIIWNPKRSFDVTALLGGIVSISCQEQNDHLTVTLRKERDLPIDPLQYNRHLRAGVLEAMLTATSLPSLIPDSSQEPAHANDAVRGLAEATLRQRLIGLASRLTRWSIGVGTGDGTRGVGGRQ